MVDKRVVDSHMSLLGYSVNMNLGWFLDTGGRSIVEDV